MSAKRAKANSELKERESPPHPQDFFPLLKPEASYFAVKTAKRTGLKVYVPVQRPYRLKALHMR